MLPRDLETVLGGWKTGCALEVELGPYHPLHRASWQFVAAVGPRRDYACFDRFALTVEARLGDAAFEPPDFLRFRPKPIPFASSDLADA